MKKQTAVGWLIKEFRKNRIVIPMQMEQQAKEMDKEQKKHAYDWGETNATDEFNGDGATYENFEQYYKETYII